MWGRVLGGGAAALTGIMLLAGAALAGYAIRTQAQLDGRLSVHGLSQPVQVRRDAADVTHVAAQSPQDLWHAVGYVHAQERGWQLEFNRRVMHGTLSEVLGPATLETDKLMRALDIRGAARRQYAGLPAQAREALQAYSAGIAAFHMRRPQALTPEFLLLGVEPGHEGGQPGPAWSPEDSVGWALMMALDLGGNWGNEFARLSLLQGLSTERLWQLMPPYPGEPPASGTDLAALYHGLGVYAQDAAPQAAAPADAPGLAGLTGHARSEWAQALAWQAGSNDGKGSNNWVVAGTRSASGKPLLANDPHLGLSVPAIWYYAHLQAPAGQAGDGTPIAAIDAIGATLPGMPFVVLGRTARVAWGFTNTNPDVQDLYLEQIHAQDPALYRTPDGWAPFALREETIRIKGRPDLKLQLRATRHGPVLSDAQASHGEVLDLSKHVLALRWTALDDDNQTVLAGLLANQAQSVAELQQAFRHYHAPMQSIVMADADGAIAFKAAGRVPVRHPGNDLRGVAPAPGWEARYDWQGWLMPEQAPQEDGGARGWVATANQRVTAPGYPHFLTQDWALPYRYERIGQLLEARALHDMGSMAAIQNDVTSLATQRLLPALRAASAQADHPLAAQVAQLLQDFDGRMAADQAAPLVFAAWADELARGLIEPRIGRARFAATYGKRDFRAAVEGILARGDAWWCAPHGCAGQSALALERALDHLQAAHGAQPARWRWGRAHMAESRHRPLGSVPALARFFSVQVPSAGDGYTVNVGQYNAGEGGGGFANRHAASLRALFDLADPENSRFIFQTGQSGNVFSPRYADMRDAWARGEYRPLRREWGRWEHELVLEPGS
ncbi:penicillin acylase family protein [Comamonas endophytica]|uniref:Penicillin acylase family protein n=1 Tax=Comamonas endophytica TaxID=2949090 RepID=A0ABY6GB50_9BURK|nr:MULTISPECIES: penicillin acylase family protein [unclassified Acidovorax]MCD2513918.1 penicillin acylase family protein [Acidovorax sp. D4N7]UYG52088.1 penicillin acylase family protein [Acidovorax sp. 5MLIR]